MPQQYPYQHIPVGSPAFFSALLAHIEESTYGQGLPIDLVVLQSILLCFISGDKHLLLRTTDDDIPLVLRVVTTILSSLFGLVTHKLRIRKAPPRPAVGQRDINSFLRSIFLPGGTRSETHKAEKRRPVFRGTKGRSHVYSRSLSQPNDTTPTSVGSDPLTDCATDTTVSPASPQAFSDPPASSGPIPDAIVLSGLEHASLPSQRALTNVFQDRRVIVDSMSSDTDQLDGVWDLPENFFMVYVCPSNAKERPAIHKTLLDYFAMSATVNLTPDIRALAKRPLSHPPLLMPVIPLSYLPCLRKSYERAHFPAQLSLYLADIFTAVRHHYEVDGSFLTARAISDAQDLARAARVLGGDPTGMQLVQDAATFEDSLSQATTETDFTDGIDKAHDFMDAERNEDASAQETTEHDVKVLDISEADIARIAPRVISHRIRVRDTDDGIFRGALIGAAMPTKRSSGHTTIKDVLIQVLADV